MSELRIVGGELRGRRIVVPEKGVRPTSERLREALMSILGASVPGQRVLDCFAGSGAVGFETLSRGASSLVFVEQAGKTCAHLKKSADKLGLGDRVTVLRGTATGHLKRLARDGETFDLLFFDPPYDRGLLAPALDCALVLLSPQAIVVAEHHIEEVVAAPSGLEVIEVRCYGQSAITLLQRKEQSLKGAQ